MIDQSTKWTIIITGHVAAWYDFSWPIAIVHVQRFLLQQQQKKNPWHLTRTTGLNLNVKALKVIVTNDTVAITITNAVYCIPHLYCQLTWPVKSGLSFVGSFENTYIILTACTLIHCTLTQNHLFTACPNSTKNWILSGVIKRNVQIICRQLLFQFVVCLLLQIGELMESFCILQYISNDLIMRTTTTTSLDNEHYVSPSLSLSRHVKHRKMMTGCNDRGIWPRQLGRNDLVPCQILSESRWSSKHRCGGLNTETHKMRLE